jgi:ZIP family zinc transporter
MDTTPVLLSVTIAFIMTLIGGAFGVKYRRNIIILMAFTAGVLIALSLFELIPEIFSLAQKTQAPIYGALFTIASGFIFLYAVNQYLFRPQKTDGKDKKTLRSSSGLLATSEFCTHALLEGLTIGLSFQFSFGLGIIAAVAVVSHDFCDGIVTITLMLSSGNSVRASLGLLVIDAAAPIVGAFATLFFIMPDNYLVFFFSFLTGGFIYLGTMHLLQKSYQHNPKWVTIVTFVSGVLLIFVLARVLNGFQ